MTVEPKSIERKRADGFIRIAQTMLGTGLAAAVPTPALELTKNIGIAAADAWMFYDIYRIYYDERLSAQRLHELLGNAGVIVMTGGVVSYGALKVSQGLVNEFLNAVPFIGWAIAGTMTGASTLTIGLAWQTYIEAQYRLSVQADKSSANGKPPRKSKSSGKKRVTIRDAAEDASDTLEEGAEDVAEDVRSTAEELRDTLEEGAEDVAEDVQSTAEELRDTLADGAQQAADDLRGTVDDTAQTLKRGADEFAVAADAEGKITTRNLDGKQGMRIDADKYWAVREAILKTIDDAADDVALETVTENVEQIVGADFEGSVRWYVNIVKVDLEVGDIIERVPGESPQRLRRKRDLN
ncbi:MAG: hypothetical protein EA396_04425 [Anaerolineaceae bacterium]|nr:MAG: hypothetical protein EA396_04425 [Anaerolineaceae bacterium]